MKERSNPLIRVQPGVFVQPSDAQLRSVPNEASLVNVWGEVGECFGYPKPDGWRIQVHKQGEIVNLFSRTGKDWAKEYPSIVQMIQAQVQDDQVILDTELVGFDQHGHHLEPSKLRYAPRYRCYLLDALYLNGTDLTPLPTKERIPFIRAHLQDAFGDVLIFAEYTSIKSQEGLIRFYQECRIRRKEGFDGAIIKRLDTRYFTDVLKIKPEDTVDAVVVGAYRNERGVVRSLLLAVPCYEHKSWVPIAKVTRTNTDWDVVWKACQFHILEHRPDDLDDPIDTPNIWIDPRVVTKVTMTELHLGKDDLVRAEYARECVLREDKGPEEATSFEQVLQMAGLTEITKTSSEKSKQLQLSLFEENANAISACALDKEPEGTSSEQILPMEDLVPEAKLLSEKPIQLQLGLFEQ